MKYTKAMVERAMNLGTADLQNAFANNGYEGDKVTTATFDSLGVDYTFIYHITYPDEETGSQEYAIVYVHYNNLAQLVADY